MEDEDRDALLQNLDARLGRVEQFLPSLSTREETHAAIKEAVAPLPTREQMHAAIQEAVVPLPTREQMHAAIREAVAPLPTREEMRAVIKEEGAKSRHHMDILVDSLRDDIRIVVEGQVALARRVTALEDPR